MGMGDKIKAFAQGKFQFGRGNAPPPGSQWAMKKYRIAKCAAGKARIDIFGQKVIYTCGYHPETVSDILTFALIVHYKYLYKQ
jgi:hypothetical protein